MARLDLADERADVVAAATQGIFALLDALDDVVLDETPSATVFDARWEALAEPWELTLRQVAGDVAAGRCHPWS